MKASQETREANAKSITEKEGAKADWQEKIENSKEEQARVRESFDPAFQGFWWLHTCSGEGPVVCDVSIARRVFELSRLCSRGVDA